MIRWLKRQLPNKDTIANQGHLSRFGEIVHDPKLWDFSRASVARGLGIGVFAAFIPLPIQTIVAVALSIIIRGNIPLAIAATWISNPITFIPFNILIYETGHAILRDNSQTFSPPIDLTIDWHDLYGTAVNWVQSLGKPFLVGVPVVAILGGLLAYFCVDIAWEVSLYFGRRKTKS
jgi:uncharacterized protein (DUF2062 family)